MISPELLEKFFQSKKELVTLAQLLKDPASGGIVLPIIDRLEESGKALLVDDKGKWSGRLDMMGFVVTEQDHTASGLTRLLLEVGELIGEEMPDLDDKEESGTGDQHLLLAQEEENYIEFNGDRLMGLLLIAMNETIAAYQR